MFLDFNMFDIYITLHKKTMEVMIPDRNVLRTRLNFLRNRDYNCPLIVFVNVTRFSKRLHNTIGVSL